MQVLVIPGGKKGLLTLALIEVVVAFVLAFLIWGPVSMLPPAPAGDNPSISENIPGNNPENTSENVLLEELPGKEPPVNINTITINLVGDIMLASRVGEAIKQNGPGQPWASLRDILSASDITLGNLECAVGSGNHQPVPGKEFTFLAAPETLEGLKDAGIDVLTLANNHILDYGPGALLETISHLENYGIEYTGAGENRTNALKPVIINKNGVTVGVLAFSCVIPGSSWIAGESKAGLNNGYDYESVYETVNMLSKQTDITIVSMHWGRELADEPAAEQKKLAHKLVEQGADIVLGHHSHVLQGLERYKNGLIAYSAGNFIFTLSRDIRGRQSMILQVDADSSGITAARVLPAWVEYGKTLPADEQISRTIIHRLQDLSGNLNTNIDDQGEIDFGV